MTRHKLDEIMKGLDEEAKADPPETHRITRVSPLTGEVNSLDLTAPASEWAAYKSGEFHIQHALKSLNDDEREFILTGIYPGEFEETVGPER